MPPQIVLFSGPACSRKSTLARDLSRRTGWPHLEMDAARVALLPDAPHTRSDREIALRAMLWTSRMLIECGHSVILDAQYRRSEDRRGVYRLGFDLGVPVRLIEASVSPDQAARWFLERGPDPVRRDLTEQIVRQGAADFPFSRDGLFLRTGQLSPEQCLRQIEVYLSHPSIGEHSLS